MCNMSLLFYICFRLIFNAAGFNISIEANPTIFTELMLNWTRNNGEPTDFWFDVFQIVDEDGSLNKELSLQVPSGSSSASGSMPFVFVRTGPHMIRGTTAESPNGFFNSTIPITAVVANSSTSSSSSNASTSHTSSSVVIGVTIGSVIPTVLILAALAVLCLHRRMKRREDTPSSSRRLHNAYSSAYELTGSPNYANTSFSQLPNASASGILNARPSRSQSHFSASSIHPPSSPGSFREMIAPQSQIEAPSTEVADVRSTRLVWSSHVPSAQTAKSRLETSVSPPPPSAE
ncbi:hypothetical protein GYMLUDRAFT_99641 [Collybiopsis luxurians FD-317 M1]|uniref:Mid2 domain-containing protein n=1 Tax=Collybiopsis luxurians FD-317 M1 TaxID=944289 RepID=A0A0D0AXA1_9AGAR|nr:hypothetical protein GYMLUDRAFT_99641 [Collybiopsis luxurians FD-317 M1]